MSEYLNKSTLWNDPNLKYFFNIWIKIILADNTSYEV